MPDGCQEGAVPQLREGDRSDLLCEASERGFTEKWVRNGDNYYQGSLAVVYDPWSWTQWGSHGKQDTSLFRTPLCSGHLIIQGTSLFRTDLACVVRQNVTARSVQHVVRPVALFLYSHVNYSHVYIEV